MVNITCILPQKKKNQYINRLHCLKAPHPSRWIGKKNKLFLEMEVRFCVTFSLPLIYCLKGKIRFSTISNSLFTWGHCNSHSYHPPSSLSWKWGLMWKFPYGTQTLGNAGSHTPYSCAAASSHAQKRVPSRVLYHLLIFSNTAQVRENQNCHPLRNLIVSETTFQWRHVI